MDKRAFDTQVNYIMRRIKIEPLPPKLFEFESGPIHFIMRASDERADLRMLIEVWTVKFFKELRFSLYLF